MVPPAKLVFSVSVRELVEFALRRGDLGNDGDFVGRSRALAGTRGHQQVQRSRPADYRKELRISQDIDAGEFILRVQGRLDGLLVSDQEVLLEEIKTVRPGWNGEANALHWAQAKCYGHLYAHEHALDRIVIQLTYLELETGRLTEFRETFAREQLRSFFADAMAIYLEWVREWNSWRETRDRSSQALAFPFPQYRPGQRELAVAAYRTIVNGGRLFLEAPTGVGKTISVLFPAVKALGEGKVERIFYLTARTVGRVVAQNAFAELRNAGLRLRTLTLTARDKLCVRDGQVCDRQTCPLCRGYYDRNKAAMRNALAHEEITRPLLETVAQAHQVCPFELSLDLSSWVDAVICDYNYVFDPKAFLRRHFAEEPRDYAFLVDEAHNLADRAREMFSAEIRRRDILQTKQAIRPALPRCARALGKVDAALRKLAGSNGPSTADPLGDLELFSPRPLSRTSAPAAGENGPLPNTPLTTPRSTRTLPDQLVSAVDNALDELEQWLTRNEPAEFRQGLLELFFALNSFNRTAALYDECYVTIIEPGPAGGARLYCVDPSRLVRQALSRGRSAIFFSATLTPLDYYQSLLGGSPEDPVLRLPSPFPCENLAVLVHSRIRTDFKARGDSLLEVVRAIGMLVKGRRGNYLAFFPSYQYLGAVQERFQSLYPGLSVLVQRPGMSEAEREAFLAPFSAVNDPTLVGFAVMGGLFGEGIDLVGDRLVGAIIVGVGLPQLCLERDLIRDYFEERARAGFDYAYLFPGMNRVLQAAGRVIRSENDRGVVLLIDSRFAQARYQRLLPPAWRLARVSATGEIPELLEQFWSG